MCLRNETTKYRDKEARKRIHLASFFAPILSSPEMVANLRKVIQNSREDVIILDFKDVEVLSRSAADEILAIRDEFTHQKTIQIANPVLAVREVFRVRIVDRAPSR